ncbi:MAG: monovalent cation/H+ antiporter subunit D family protein [Epulopiscium sp.]|nr:monovalent cation/H+ antiporter subunit D family protein [Candidatus Epulonipiscium sp.]
MLYLILALSSGIIGGLIVALMPRDGERVNNLRKLIVALSTISGMVFSWRVAHMVFAGKHIKIAGQFGGLAWSFAPDPLGIIFGLIASTLWLFAAIYSFGYMEGKQKQRTYYIFFLISLSMTLGVAFSGNLVALYLFYELLTFATYPLVIHERNPEAMKAGSKYIMYSLSGAGAILIAIVITYSWTGNLEFTGTPILAHLYGPELNWLLLLFFLGFGVKAAVMPLHQWLPEAMAAPTPVSALLHAVAVVYSGAYGILRVVYSIFGYELMGKLSFSTILIWIVAITILMGVIIAIRQDVLKRRLAYQTISHISYILLGALTLHPWGLAGAIMHMISYSTLKITLFFCAGIIAEQTGETKISRMGEIGWNLPKTMTIFSIATLGMIGILPLNTFWGKYYLMKGSAAGGKWPLALVLIGSGILNAVCFIPVIVNAFRGRRKGPRAEAGGRAFFMLTPTVILTVVAVFMGIWPGVVWPGVEAVVNWFF